jgi:AcrR family transcriptional regulator
LGRDERRETVLRAGRVEFGRLGYAAARIDDIARAAGVTKPIVYRHFGSKKGLYLALLERHETDLPTFFDGLGEVAPERVARTILEGWLDYVRANGHTWLMLFRDSSGDEEIQQVRLRVSRTAREVLAGFIAQRSPAMPDEQVAPTAEMLTSGLAGLALWWIDHPDTPKETVVEVAARMSEPAL